MPDRQMTDFTPSKFRAKLHRACIRFLSATSKIETQAHLPLHYFQNAPYHSPVPKHIPDQRCPKLEVQDPVYSSPRQLIFAAPQDHSTLVTQEIPLTRVRYAKVLMGWGGAAEHNADMFTSSLRAMHRRRIRSPPVFDAPTKCV